MSLKEQAALAIQLITRQRNKLSRDEITLLDLDLEQAHGIGFEGGVIKPEGLHMADGDHAWRGTVMAGGIETVHLRIHPSYVLAAAEKIILNALERAGAFKEPKPKLRHPLVPSGRRGK